MRHPIRTITIFGRNRDFVEHITKFGVEFLIVGGTVVHFYGCRDDGQVDDLDLLLNPSLGNAQTFVNSSHSLGININWTVERLTQPKVQIPIKADFYLDIVTPKAGIKFSDLRERSEAARIGVVNVRVIGREDLIEMKQDAIDELENDIGKHRKDLECLMAV